MGGTVKPVRARKSPRIAGDVDLYMKLHAWIEKEKKDSHIYKHWSVHHEGVRTRFSFEILSFYESPLERQIGEAVRIDRTGMTCSRKAVLCSVHWVKVAEGSVSPGAGSVRPAL